MSNHSSAHGELEAAILSRLINPQESTLSAEAARSIIALGFSEADLAKMNALAGKAHDGQLSSDEDVELEAYLRIGRMLALLQAKARQSLQRFAGVPA